MVDTKDAGRSGEPGPLPPFEPRQPARSRDPQRPRRVLLRAAGTVLVVALLLGVTLLVARRPRGADPAPRRENTYANPVWQMSAVTVRSGEVMPAALARAGMPDSLAGRAVAVLVVGGFDFRRMRPGDSLTVEHRGPDEWRLYYQTGPERTWLVEFGEADRVGVRMVRTERVPVFINGVISSSLWDAMLQQGQEPALVLDFARVLGWEVDFFTETQSGDSFAVYVTRRLVDSQLVGYEPVIAVRYNGAVGDLAGFRYTDPEGRTDYYNPDGECMRKTFLKSPLDFGRVTSFFGRRFHPIHRVWRQHHGLDYTAPTGTPVSVVAEGRVVRAGWHGGYGNCIDVRHPGGYLTRYGHLSRFGRGVRVGASVSQGQVIGYVGSTGVSTGPHLHFELHENGVPINPLRFDPPRAEPVRPEFLEDFVAVRDSLLGLAPGLRPRR